MERFVKLMQRHLIASLLLLGSLLATACGSGDDGLGPDKAIVEHPAAVESDQIVNGSAYDVGWLELDGLSRLTLPPAARVVRSEELEAGKARIRLTKSLGYAGDPPAPMTPRHARHYMGVATKRDNDNETSNGTLKLGTYGEWDSQGAGRAWIAIEVELPADTQIEIKHDEDLGGEQSIAAGKLELTDNTGHWYKSNKPATNWQPLPTNPDKQAANAERRNP